MTLTILADNNNDLHDELVTLHNVHHIPRKGETIWFKGDSYIVEDIHWDEHLLTASIFTVPY